MSVLRRLGGNQGKPQFFRLIFQPPHLRLLVVPVQMLSAKFFILLTVDHMINRLDHAVSDRANGRFGTDAAFYAEKLFPIV